MQITVTGRHVEVPHEIREYTVKKSEKLLKYHDRIQSIEAIWDHEGDQVSLEVLVNAGSRNTFVSKELGSDGNALVDLVVEKLERQLTKHKSKIRDHSGNNRHAPGSLDPGIEGTPLSD